MSEYWKSTPIWTCPYCKCNIHDNAASRRKHEAGTKHKEAVQKHLDETTRKQVLKRQENEELRKILGVSKEEFAKMSGQELDMGARPLPSKPVAKESEPKPSDFGIKHKTGSRNERTIREKEKPKAYTTLDYKRDLESRRMLGVGRKDDSDDLEIVTTDHYQVTKADSKAHERVWREKTPSPEREGEGGDDAPPPPPPENFQGEYDGRDQAPATVNTTLIPRLKRKSGDIEEHITSTGKKVKISRFVDRPKDESEEKSAADQSAEDAELDALLG